MASNLVPYKPKTGMATWGKAVVNPASLGLIVLTVIAGAFWIPTISMALGAAWLLTVIILAVSGNSPTAQRRAFIRKLTFRHRADAKKALKVVEEVKSSISSAPTAYSSSFMTVEMEVERLVDKLLGLYPIIEGMTRYQRRAKSISNSTEADEILTRSLTSKEKLEQEAESTLALLNSVQGQVLMMIGSAASAGSDSPASQAERLSTDISEQTQALDEARAYLDGDWDDLDALSGS